MKAGHDITINRKRVKATAGGEMASLDPVTQGRVQLLQCPPGDVAQAVVAVDELVRLSRLDPDWNWSKTAIIAREWRRLDPVRAHAEALGIPVQMANESLPNIWRLREMQSLIAALRHEPARLMGIANVVEALNCLPPNRWTDLIAEGIAALARELANKTMPVPDLIEWLAEWARDTRGEQQGLLLLTAHRAKGLEFDDVVILDGNWEAFSSGEDADAPRRLFYVAMTRARRSLAVMTAGLHPFVHPGSNSILARQVKPEMEAIAGEMAIYQMPDLKLVDLSWAGRLADGKPALGAITEARVGDPIALEPENGAWLIQDAKGRTIGRMARTWTPPEGRLLKRGEVGAVVCWRKAESWLGLSEQLRAIYKWNPARFAFSL